MTINRKTVDEAAFWDLSICLDCGRQMDEDVELSEDEEGNPACPHCGGTVLFARIVQEALMKVEDEEC